MKAEKKTFKALIDEAEHYRVPGFQREYSWRKESWEALFIDLLTSDKGYFIGSIICLEPSEEVRDIIDGQQRLTTLSLLSLALYKALKARQDDFINDAGRRHRWDALLLLVRKDNSNDPVLRLLEQNNNDHDYRYLLGEELEGPHIAPLGHEGNRSIYRAFRAFERLIDEHLQTLDDLFAYADKVLYAQFVYISAETTANAYALFNSLNARGTALSAVDLIKTNLFEQFSKRAALEPPEQDWSSMLSSFGNDRDITERFFRHNYNAFMAEIGEAYAGNGTHTGGIIGSKKIATKTSLLTIYEALVKADPVGIMKMLRENARLYSSMIRENAEQAATPLSSAYLDLVRVKGAPAYILLLYLARRQDELNWQDEQMARLVRLLVSFFVRRSLTEQPPTYKLDRMFMELIADIRGQRLTGQAIYDHVRAKLYEESADEETFRQKLNGPLYDEREDTTRFILCSLAGEPRHLAQVWSRDKKGNYIWTIEHIMPQTLDDKCKDWWPELVAGKTPQEVMELSNKYKHTLGNLTLTAYNSSWARRSFKDKRDLEDERTHEHIGFRSGFALNRSLLDKEAWDFDCIQERTKELVEEVVRKFSL